MKTLLALLLTIILFASVASAEVLVTANPLGKGVWGFEIAGMQDSNFLDQSDGKLTSYGGYIGYGLLDSLDVYLDVGSLASSGLSMTFPTIPPTTIDMDISGTAYGVSLKYTLLHEGENMPVSLALAGRYRATSQTMDMGILGKSKSHYAQSTLGIGVSKIMAPFIPYLGLAYRDMKDGSDDFATQTDITLGTAIAWSMQGAVFVEYTSQSIQDKSGTVNDHTSGQIAIGVAYATR